MLSTEFEILTPLSKIHRISRQIADRETFAIEPGMWVKLNNDGQVVNFSSVIQPEAGIAVELCINNSANGALAAYEANDTKVGRITTIMEPGARVVVGTGLIDGPIAAGNIVAINASQDSTTGATEIYGTWIASTSHTTGTIAVGVIVGTQGDLAEIRLTEQKWA